MRHSAETIKLSMSDLTGVDAGRRNQMKVLQYPDKRLRKSAEPVGEITDDVRSKIQQMFAVMYAQKGIGLAAPQVDWPVRLFVMNVSGAKKDELVLINPEILEERGGTWLIEEACLSVPGISGKVKRSKEIIIKAQSINGEEFTVKATGMIARCMLHEYDHLDGTLFIDRLSPAKKAAIKGKLRRLEQAANAAEAEAAADTETAEPTEVIEADLVQPAPAAEPESAEEDQAEEG